MPVKIPVIEMIEIGAGGGSIARVDALGLLKVGPESAGADPGPVCYGRGGSEPTVTDADLVLGYLDPRLFSGRAHGARSGSARARRSSRQVARAARPERRSRPPGAFIRSSTKTWPTPRACIRWSAAKIRGACRCSPSAAPGRCMPIASRRRWARRADRAVRRRRDEHSRFSDRAAGLRLCALWRALAG